MEFTAFNAIVDRLRNNNKAMFGLSGDSIATEKELVKVENHYKIKLSKDYRNFLQTYGGGYFGYTIVYSCDSSSRFYLINNVGVDWINMYHFLPIIDLETGDLAGYRINDQKCEDYISVFCHDNNSIIDYNLDLFDYILKQGLNN